jgi:hypothetical protein
MVWTLFSCLPDFPNRSLCNNVRPFLLAAAAVLIPYFLGRPVIQNTHRKNAVNITIIAILVTPFVLSYLLDLFQRVAVSVI